MANYLAADPAAGGDPKTLNIASMADSLCISTCSWSRTVSSALSAPMDWTVSIDAPAGITLTVSPENFTLDPGAEQVIQITVDASSEILPQGVWAFAEIALMPDDPKIAEAHFPVAIQPFYSILPELVEIDAQTTAGSEEIVVAANEIITLTTEIDGLAAATILTNPLNEGELFLTFVDVPVGATRLVAEVIQSEAPNVILGVGIGLSPGPDSLVCSPFTLTWEEYCNIDDPTPGPWWIVVQSWTGSADQPDLVTLSYAAVQGDQGNMTVEGPTSVPAATPFDLSINWDIPGMAIGDRYYGSFSLGSEPSSPGDIGDVNVDLTYVGEPAIDLPKVVHSSQLTGTLNTVPMVIGNVGSGELSWEIGEADTSPVALAGPIPFTPPISLDVAGLLAQSTLNSPEVAPAAASGEIIWDQPAKGGTGIVSNYSTTEVGGAYVASDFEITAFVNIDLIFADGFDNSNTLSEQPAIDWIIYADENGVPAGHPEDGLDNHVWHYSASPSDPEVDITSNKITLDLAAAGVALNLTPGTYWLTVYPTYENDISPGGSARWNWFYAQRIGAQAHLISPSLLGINGWTPYTSLNLAYADAAFRLEGAFLCRPDALSWVSVSPTSGMTSGGDSSVVDVTFDSTGMEAGDYAGTLCVESDDPADPFVPVPVTMSVVDNFKTYLPFTNR
jgi:hypothetical protein